MSRLMPFRRARRALAPLFLLAALSLVGCSSDDKPASVTGKVTYKGKPVTSGVVVFIAEDGKASDPGSVNESGVYTIQRAPAGKMKVSFDNPPPAVPSTTDPKSGAANEEAKQALIEAKRYVATPPQYRDPNKLNLTVELKPGKNEVDIKLP